MSDAASLRIVPVSLRKQVEDGLRAAIAEGRFAPGAHLSDRALCEAFGASRSVVREAVRRLEAEAIVTLLPNRGAFVAWLPEEEARQIYELRGALEGLAGEGFARRASAAERAELGAVLTELASLGDGATTHELLVVKQRFYAVLLRGCGNAHVSRTLEPLLSRIAVLRGTSLAAPGRLSHTVAEVRRIVDAVAARDPVAAGQACRDHVARAAEAAMSVIRAKQANSAQRASWSV